MPLSNIAYILSFARNFSCSSLNSFKEVTSRFLPLEKFKPRPNDRNMLYRNIVGHNMMRAFGRHVGRCCDMLRAVEDRQDLSQQHPSCCNTAAKYTQHIAPNNVAICYVHMLRSFGRGFSVNSSIFLYKIFLYM